MTYKPIAEAIVRATRSASARGKKFVEPIAGENATQACVPDRWLPKFYIKR
jgi:hypothetical protein